MDSNFVTILFFLFIIFVVFSSMLKKKPEEGIRRIKKDASSDDEDYKINGYIERTSDKERIQKEISALFENRISSDDNDSAGQLDAGEAGTISVKEEVSGGQKVYMYYDKSEAGGAKTTNKTEDKIAAEAKEFENVLHSMTMKENKYLADLRMRIKNTKNLKDYIVISEILGKPKALRR